MIATDYWCREQLVVIKSKCGAEDGDVVVVVKLPQACCQKKTRHGIQWNGLADLRKISVGSILSQGPHFR